MEESQLARALASVQRNLPTIRKGKTAKIDTKTGGNYTYKFADLPTISAKITPLLLDNDLLWLTKPTMKDGLFVLTYRMEHMPSGEKEDGDYPLPPPNTAPQALGSAITFARRYALCCVVGLVPSEDDDGRGASQAVQVSQQQQQRSSHRPEGKARSDAPASVADDEVTDSLNARIRKLPKDLADPIRQKIEEARFPNPFPAGAVRQVDKWLKEAEAGAPF